MAELEEFSTREFEGGCLIKLLQTRQYSKSLYVLSDLRTIFSTMFAELQIPFQNSELHFCLSTYPYGNLLIRR